jgi:hypothetical protein
MFKSLFQQRIPIELFSNMGMDISFVSSTMKNSMLDSITYILLAWSRLFLSIKVRR